VLRLYDSVDGEVRDFNLRDPVTSRCTCAADRRQPAAPRPRPVHLVWDIARRWFTFRGLDVNYVSNITDIEDKIIARSLQEGRSTAEVVATYEGLWWEAMDNSASRDRRGAARHGLGPQMIELISGFLENDIAYVISDGVYSTSRASRLRTLGRPATRQPSRR